MRCRALSLSIIISLVFSAAFAQSPRALSDITASDCAGLLPLPDVALLEVAPDLAGSPVAALIAEGIIRQCAALGYLTLQEDGQPEPTRSTGAESVDEDQAAQLEREARYYIETAEQIDPDASNDLLRRLLGGPRPEE